MTRSILLALAVLVACGDNGGPSGEAERRVFIAKAAQALHPSSPPLTARQIDALLEQPDEAIITALYADPSTRDAVFRLSLAFLGAPADRIYADGSWASLPFRYQPAVSAVRAFRNGTDPLAPLFTVRSVIPVGVVDPVPEDLLEAIYGPRPPLEGTSAERRAAAGAVLLADVATFRAQIAALPEPFDVTAMCDLYLVANASFAPFFIPDLLGVPAPIIGSSIPLELQEPIAFPLDDACFFEVPTTREEALANLDGAAVLYAGLMARLEPILARWEANPDLAFDAFDPEPLGFTAIADPAKNTPRIYPEFWRVAQNSSTNYNRRRGAYVLDRYFCDDLIPVGAALPEAHGAGAHATDPACASCHFKLDPMAGFFRRHGRFGREHTDAILNNNGGVIRFDDQATTKYADYEAAWRAPAGSGREFDVGYIRSTRDPSLNSYGSTLTDLDQLLGQAPEVERCFAQRMFEMWNGVDQAVDPGFLDDVAADMHAAGPDRLLRAAVRILTGATFRAPERNSTVCYDLAPGTEGSNRPPCEVASILRANCTSCHGGANPQSGLDLSIWEKGSDGRFGFRHGAVTRTDTFERMRERVMTSDLTRQMPMAKDMPLRQREQLALWLQGMIDQP